MTGDYVEALGIAAIATMVVCYWLETYGHIFVALFAAGCAAAAVYAYFIGSYPFLVAEGIWALIAAWRWHTRKDRSVRQAGIDQRNDIFRMHNARCLAGIYDRRLTTKMNLRYTRGGSLY